MPIDNDSERKLTGWEVLERQSLRKLTDEWYRLNLERSWIAPILQNRVAPALAKALKLDESIIRKNIILLDAKPNPDRTKKEDPENLVQIHLMAEGLPKNTLEILSKAGLVTRSGEERNSTDPKGTRYFRLEINPDALEKNREVMGELAIERIVKQTREEQSGTDRNSPLDNKDAHHIRNDLRTIDADKYAELLLSHILKENPIGEPAPPNAIPVELQRLHLLFGHLEGRLRSHYPADDKFLRARGFVNFWLEQIADRAENANDIKFICKKLESILNGKMGDEQDEMSVVKIFSS